VRVDNMNNELGVDILSSIENIDNVIIESEISVMDALINAYDKAIMILENCDDDCSSFDIFQEGLSLGKDGEDHINSKKENILKKILNMIKILLKKLGALIRKQILGKVFIIKYGRKDLSFQNLKKLRSTDPIIDEMLRTTINLRYSLKQATSVYESSIGILRELFEINDFDNLKKWFSDSNIKTHLTDMENLILLNNDQGETCTLEQYYDFLDTFSKLRNELNGLNLPRLNDKIYTICTENWDAEYDANSDLKIHIASNISMFIDKMNKLNIELDRSASSIIPNRFNEKFKEQGFPIYIKMN
jgi:hypothetical protein